jgi:hypothetical protein
MVVLSRHARARMAERGISLSELEHALAHQLVPPISGNQAGTVVLEGSLPGGLGILKIVVPAADHSRIVTVWRG